MTIQKYTTQLFSISANEQRKSDTYYFKVLKEQDKWMCCWLSSHEQGNERLWASEEPEAGGPSLLFVMLSRWSWSYCQPGKASVPWQPLFLQHCSFNWRPSLLVSWVAVARFHVKALPMKTKKTPKQTEAWHQLVRISRAPWRYEMKLCIYSKLNTAVPEPLSGINRCSPSEPSEPFFSTCVLGCFYTSLYPYLRHSASRKAQCEWIKVFICVASECMEGIHRLWKALLAPEGVLCVSYLNKNHF